MKEKDSDDEEDNYIYKEIFSMKTYKVILVGESGVGKTCIISYFSKGKAQENCETTLASEYVEKTIELSKYGGKKIKFGIWDTVGQEKYRVMTKNFFVNASAAIIVYDITKKESFEEIKKFWYSHVIEYCPEGINKFLFFNYYYLLL